ncbi:hypothetical protein RHECIAT_CH0002294 [Rhizobium etli CIAT 652]|uniref:Uncharacterized protein n=1 Tax=Rhizobium etli (strain CIAT 652) TaxID=491916 RepID=B3PNW3_RHIE6|nr:hypothetical protein RHECIAT_CH0002294 [Rhizobium etli CIAT 652]KKZ85495.1 hypothetical protein RPHASCH2410_CH21200 [Rhizobium phaseoli Ch24-10]
MVKKKAARNVGRRTGNTEERSRPGQVVQNFEGRSDGTTVSRQAPRLNRNPFLTLTAGIWHEIRKVEVVRAMSARK